jgi:hypothetical protein
MANKLEEDLHEFLKHDPGLAAAVAGRVHYDTRPQKGPLPALTFRQPDAGDDYNLADEATHAEPVIEIECWAATYLAARDLAQVVRAAMKRLEEGVTLGVTTIDTVFCEDETPITERKGDGSDDLIYGRAMDFLFMIRP